MKNITWGLVGLLGLVASEGRAASVSATLNANIQVVNGPSSVTLTWTSSGAGKCTATGDWSGVKNFSGSEVVQVVKASSYTLTCESPTGPATLSWTPSTTYSDGSPLVIKSYQVMNGPGVATLARLVVVQAPATQAVVQSPPGLTFFTVRVQDAAGIESPDSTSVSRQIVPDTSAPRVQVAFTVLPNPVTNFQVQ